MERLDLRVNGVQICCFAHGPANGRPAILLHGAGGNGRWWDQTAAFLCGRGYRVYAPDMRGHGDSEKPATGYDADTLIADLTGLADELGVPRATWFGHSWTGKLLFALGARHPERADRLVMVDPASPRGFGRHRETVMNWAKEVWGKELGPHPSVAAAWEALGELEGWRNRPALEGAFAHGFVVDPDETVTGKATLGRILTLLDQLDTDMTAALPAISPPSLIAVLPSRVAHFQALADQMPAATVEGVEANHWIYVDNPEGFQSALIRHGFA